LLATGNPCKLQPHRSGQQACGCRATFSLIRNQTDPLWNCEGRPFYLWYVFWECVTLL
jgi:hypothetical protein